MDLKAFREDAKTYDAVERCLERIAEAAANLGDLAPVLVPVRPGVRSGRSAVACVMSTTSFGKTGSGTSCRWTFRRFAPRVRMLWCGCAKAREGNDPEGRVNDLAAIEADEPAAEILVEFRKLVRAKSCSSSRRKAFLTTSLAEL